jgi:phage anti-repressor protein
MQMRSIKTKQQSSIKDGSLVAVDSRNELPLIQQGDNLLIDARLLHQQLKSATVFANWIKRRIEEFGFKEGLDFFPTLEKSKTKPLMEYHLTLDMAKELSMLERNEVGRAIRLYFIQKEKEARAISHLPKEAGLFKGLKPKRLNDRILYVYREVLERCGYKTNSNGNRRHRYWMHFVKEGNLLFVTEEFGLHLFRQKQVISNRAAMLNAMPILPLNFGDIKQLQK